MLSVRVGYVYIMYTRQCCEESPILVLHTVALEPEAAELHSMGLHLVD